MGCRLQTRLLHETLGADLMAPIFRHFYDSVDRDPEGMNDRSGIVFRKEIIWTFNLSSLEMDVQCVHTLGGGGMFDFQVRLLFDIKIMFGICRCPSHPSDLSLVIFEVLPKRFLFYE